MTDRRPMFDQQRSDAFIHLTQIAEGAPHMAGYRQFVAGPTFSAILGDRRGLQLAIDGTAMTIDADQVASLRDWLNRLP